MTTQELQDFAKEIGATLDFYPTRLTVKTADCSVSIDVGRDRTINKQKIARLFIDKIDSVFGASDDLLKIREQLEQIK